MNDENTVNGRKVTEDHLLFDLDEMFKIEKFTGDRKWVSVTEGKEVW